MTSKVKELRPGETAPVWGQYQWLGLRREKGKEVTVTTDELIPVLPNKGETYNLVDWTNLNRGY